VNSDWIFNDCNHHSCFNLSVFSSNYDSPVFIDAYKIDNKYKVTATVLKLWLPYAGCDFCQLKKVVSLLKTCFKDFEGIFGN